MYSIAALTLVLATIGVSATNEDGHHRTEAQRLRKPEHSTFTSATLSHLIPDYGNLLKKTGLNAGAVEEEDKKADEIHDALEELDKILTSGFDMSLHYSDVPSAVPSALTTEPSTTPSVSLMPTIEGPTFEPTSGPTVTPSAAPSVSAAPSAPPTDVPTATPTICGIPEQDRIAGILAVLDSVADPDLIRDNNFPQGLATTWLIQDDGHNVCPDDPKLIQRWVLAVIYFSTGGDEWFQCSNADGALDLCGAEDPFVGDARFLSSGSECTWAGISCIDGCVTEIEFEENNLVGTIPTEIGLLSDLLIWGMERGGLEGSIPTEIGRLSNLIFIDLDFNQLTGSLSSELLSLTSLTQLDLNDNRMTGSVEGIGVFPDLEFLQLHANFFTGTIPSTMGQSTRLAAFTLHETEISGTMPESICDLLQSENNGGVLTSLIADCSRPNPDIVCSCCTDCRNT